jgi:hypothetical protein
MTTPRRTLDRMTCPTCGRSVAFRLIRPPRVNPGRYGAIPGIRKPVRHKQPHPEMSFTAVGNVWCPAGEP